MTRSIPGRRRRALPAVGPLVAALPLLVRSRRRGLRDAEQRTLAIGALAAATTTAALAAEVGRVWRRGSAPLPSETGDLIGAAEEAVTETVEAAVVGYQDVSTRENAMFNLLGAFVVSFGLARGIAHLLRSRRTFGPFRDVRVGGRHIHHFVPGIVLSFVSGAAAIVSRNERLEPKLALTFGAGMGLTLDESALLLELEDVYWTQEGVVGVQIALAATSLMGALALGWRFLRRGEELVLPASDETPGALESRRG